MIIVHPLPLSGNCSAHCVGIIDSIYNFTWNGRTSRSNHHLKSNRSCCLSLSWLKKNWDSTPRSRRNSQWMLHLFCNLSFFQVSGLPWEKWWKKGWCKNKHLSGGDWLKVPKKVPLMEIHGNTYIHIYIYPYIFKAVVMVYWRRIFYWFFKFFRESHVIFVWTNALWSQTIYLTHWSIPKKEIEHLGNCQDSG